GQRPHLVAGLRALPARLGAATRRLACDAARRITANPSPAQQRIIVDEGRLRLRAKRNRSTGVQPSGGSTGLQARRSLWAERSLFKGGAQPPALAAECDREALKGHGFSHAVRRDSQVLSAAERSFACFERRAP